MGYEESNKEIREVGDETGKVLCGQIVKYHECKPRQLMQGTDDCGSWDCYALLEVLGTSCKIKLGHILSQEN